MPLEERRAIIEAAIAAEQELEIVYLRENNARHRRRIIPRQLRSIEYDGEPCLGVEAFCLDRQTNWIFRLNCMLDIQPVTAAAEGQV